MKKLCEHRGKIGMEVTVVDGHLRLGATGIIAFATTGASAFGKVYLVGFPDGQSAYFGEAYLACTDCVRRAGL